jgi:hypothetical protein
MMYKSICWIPIAVIGILGCNSSSNQSTARSGPDSAIIGTAKDAFIFGLALALMDISCQKLTNFELPSDGKGAPINQFTIFSKFPDADFRDVVRPNNDTYYTIAVLDLRAEPLVLYLPNSNGRYYLMPMMDAYTNVFFSPGKRTTGTEARTYLVTGPN